MRKGFVVLMISAVVTFATRDRASQGPNAVPVSPRSCAGLAALTLPNTTITTEIVAAGAFRPPQPPRPGAPTADFATLPAFCRVWGSITPSADSDIRFELWLPAQNWNGRFLQTGNGGAAGSIFYETLADPLARGYAVANTDTGHQGEQGDFTWAANHPERLIDYQYRAAHELTVVGKALTTARYGRPPAKAYWDGCSAGGRQGLKEAQRFPDDYDAIVAGAPASNWSALMAFSIIVERNLTGADALSVDKLGLLKEAAIAACDAQDGVVDRVIGRPASCRFDPASLQCGTSRTDACLSATEVAAATRVYAGVVNRAGHTLLAGPGPGSEPQWAIFASPQFRFSIGSSYFRHVVAHDPDWDPARFDVDADVARMEAQDAGAAKAMDPDLSAFIARGGKLLTYHGTADGLIPYANSIDYHDRVVAARGADAVRDHFALYVVPGMAHCGGGDGASAIDWLGALEAWDATGQPPPSILGTHRPPASAASANSVAKPFTRPICRYPQWPAYNGAGDESDAASWSCVNGDRTTVHFAHD
jgi:feruloyl esterase